MKASQAADIILVQAIEAVDEDGEILSFEERRLANEALEGEGAGSPLEAELARAERMIPHVKRRAPWLWHTTHAFSTVPWLLVAALAALALFFGASFQILGSGKKFHVFSLPLLGLLAWNLVSLGLLLVGPLLASRLSGRELEESYKASSWGQSALNAFLWLRQKWDRWRKPESQDLLQQVSWRALGRYWERWPRHASALLQAQTARVLHICTLCFCLSALFVAYGHGLNKQYVVTAESTFLSASAIQVLLKLIFWPTTLFLGELPKLSGSAGPWIHRYAFLLCLFVIVPRLLLAVWTTLRSIQFTAHLSLSMEALSQVPTLNLALASHTNVGKTSLARTLLRRDVGEVRDAEHVTRRRAGYFLLNTPEARLRLWDTPGFGDAKALTQNLRDREGWAWLRSLQDPKLRFDREAALSLQEEADLILYLVPAYADDQVEQTLRDEWEVLREIGTPVICILNRLENADGSEEERLLSHWKAFFLEEELCKQVLSLDAFSRDLDDEQALFEAIEASVLPERRALATQLRELWEAQRALHHKASGTLVARALRTLSQDSEREAGKEGALKLQARAQKLIQEVQNQLLEHMGLKGEIRDRMLSQSEDFLRSMIPDRGERTWGAIIGGALSGLASGIMADVLAGGLTFFGGAAVGMIVGALGGAGVAEGYRRVGKKGARKLVWDKEFLHGVALRLTLLYVASAAFGRAQGEFTDDVILAASTPKAEGETEYDVKVARRQAQFFEASTAALERHWKFLWQLLEVDHDPKRPGKKPWDDLVISTATPAWVRGSLEREKQQESSASFDKSEALERGCEALLNDARELWGEVRDQAQA